MICEAFIIAWNEIETIHLTIKHYQKFCDQITILDNFSDDGTRAKAEGMGCKVQTFGILGKLDDNEYLKIKNSVYLRSTAKYVIVCDSDEILWHSNIRQILEQDTGTVFNTIGWDIFSNDMPKNDFLEIQNGHFQPNYCKKIIFSPKIRINFEYGSHTCKPKGDLRPSNELLTLFHYSNIGGFKRLSERHKIYRERMSENNRRIGLGCHYNFPEAQRKEEWYGKFEGSYHYDLYDHSRVDPFFIQ